MTRRVPKRGSMDDDFLKLSKEVDFEKHVDLSCIKGKEGSWVQWGPVALSDDWMLDDSEKFDAVCARSSDCSSRMDSYCIIYCYVDPEGDRHISKWSEAVMDLVQQQREQEQKVHDGRKQARITTYFHTKTQRT